MLYVQTLSNHITYVFSSFATSFANKPFRPTPSRLPSCIRPSSPVPPERHAWHGGFLACSKCNCGPDVCDVCVCPQNSSILCAFSDFTTVQHVFDDLISVMCHLAQTAAAAANNYWQTACTAGWSGKEMVSQLHVYGFLMFFDIYFDN